MSNVYCEIKYASFNNNKTIKSMNQNEKKDAIGFLKKNGGTELQNSNGVRIGNTVYKDSESGKSIITNKGDKFPTLHDLKTSVNNK